MRCVNFHQQGAALMVMLVILILGTATLMLNALGSASVHIERDKKTTAALAQAKDGLISNAATYLDIPGSLPCPDTDNDGISDAGGGTECPSYLGRLPWKTLGLPDLRDGSGERLWYTLSSNVRRYASVHPLNSDTQGTLDITGVQAASQVMAIVFSPGLPLAGQNRSSTDLTACTSTATSPDRGELCANNYLEGSNPNKSSTTNGGLLNTHYQANAASDTFNDQLLLITHDQLFTVVEQRIAREVKACLDNYATAKGGKYPWAAPTQNIYQSGKTDSQFGRIPYQAPLNDNKINDFLEALANLQTQVTACITSDSGSNANALDHAGQNLEQAANTLKQAQPTSPAISSAVTEPGKQAGDKAQDSNMCDTIHTNPLGNSVQTDLNATLGGLASALSNLTATSHSDSAVQCDTLFKNSAYWQDWKNGVFYQVDDEYKPNGGLGTPSIQINSTGNYHATVIVARSLISPQIRTPLANPPTGYLEGGNAHTTNNPNKNFIAYRPSEAGFTTVNDLVLCLDGRQKCK